MRERVFIRGNPALTTYDVTGGHGVSGDDSSAAFCRFESKKLSVTFDGIHVLDRN
jgi:hypothetical protein